MSLRGRISALLACGVALAIAGCGGGAPTRDETTERYGAELREAVATGVDDPARRTQMLQLVDRINAVQARFNQETAEYIDGYRRLNADYDAPRPAFDQLFANYEGQRIKARGEALDLHYALTSLATQDEWKAVGRAEAKLYEEANEARWVKESTE